MKNKVVKNAMTHGHAFSTKTWRVQNHGPARALTYGKNLKIHKHKNIMDLYCKWNVFWFSIIIVFFLVWYRHMHEFWQNLHHLIQQIHSIDRKTFARVLCQCDVYRHCLFVENCFSFGNFNCSERAEEF